MDYNIYLWITSPIIFGVWFYIAITGIRQYMRMMKIPGMSPFMNRRTLNDITDLNVINAVKQWKKLTRRLFLLWLLTGFGFMIITMIISRAGGFINEPK